MSLSVQDSMFKTPDLLEVLGGAVGSVPVYEPLPIGDFGIPSQHKEVRLQGVTDTTCHGLRPFTIVAINPSNHDQPGYVSLDVTLPELLKNAPTVSPSKSSVMSYFSKKPLHDDGPVLLWNANSEKDLRRVREISLSQDYYARLGVKNAGIKAVFSKGATHRLAVYNRSSYYFQPIHGMPSIDNFVSKVNQQLYNGMMRIGCTSNEQDFHFGIVTMVASATINVLAHQKHDALLQVGINKVGGFDLGGSREGFYHSTSAGIVGFRMQTYYFDRSQDDKVYLKKGINLKRGNRLLNDDPFTDITKRVKDQLLQGMKRGEKDVSILASVALSGRTSRTNSDASDFDTDSLPATPLLTLPG